MTTSVRPLEIQLPRDLKYPIRITEVHVSRGVHVKEGDPLYTFTDREGGAFLSLSSYTGSLAETPVPVGASFDGPVIIAYVTVAADAETGPVPAPDAMVDLAVFLAADIDKSKNKTFRHYRAAAMNWLMARGHATPDARDAVDEGALQQRWEGGRVPEAAPQAAPDQRQTQSPTGEAAAKSTSPRQTTGDPATLIAELDGVARAQGWTSYRMAAEKHLKAHGIAGDTALQFMETPGVKDRWRKLNAGAAEPASAPEPAPEPVASQPVTSGAAPDAAPAPGGMVPVANNYGASVIAIILGGLATAIYAALSLLIPLVIIGTVVPLLFALFGIFLSYNIIRGSTGFRVMTCVLGAAVNVTVLWFAYFWIRWSLQDALDVFAAGPMNVLESIYVVSTVTSFGFGEISNAGEPDFMISGVVLRILWGLEALLLTLAIGLAYLASSSEQHVPSNQKLSEGATSMARDGLPALGAIVFGVIRASIAPLIVLGIVVLVVNNL